MGKKGGKRNLSTGNTIRQFSAALRKYQKYGCLVVTEDLEHENSPAAKKVISDISTALPSKGNNTVEFSLNKQKRWELPDYLRQKVEMEQDSTDVQITMMEHTLMPMSSLAMQRWDTCDSYYSNLGNVRQCISNTEMNITSAKQGYRQEDHLSKLERRRLRKKRNAGLDDTEALEVEFESGLPKYECHVVYGAPTNGKLYKNITTKACNKSRKSQNDTSGCSKRFLSKVWYDEDDELPCLDDEDVDDVERIETPSSPITVPLSEFLVPSTNRNKRRTRKSSGTSTGSSNMSSLSTSSSSDKEWVVFVDDPLYPKVPTSRRPESSTSSTPNLYAPQYTSVVMKEAELDMATLAVNFGDKYREAYSTPRTLAFDLSDELGATANGERFYLVVVVRCESNGPNYCRVYCTGDGVDSKSSCIPTLQEETTYNLVTLKNMALSHGLALCTEREMTLKSGPKGNRGAKTGFGASWNVSSSHLSELVPQTVNDLHRQTEENIRNKMGDSDGLYIPYHMQRSLSCLPHCGVCFEELNDNVLHSALLSCHHYFCNECWTAHINNCIREGLALITCPEYECKKQVDAVFIMSMVEFSTYHLHEIHLTEFTLFSEQKANWCPSKRCGRVLHCDDELAEKKEPITANCKCGTECCFKCLDEPHWPLSCQQLSTYHDKLQRDGLKCLDTFEGFESEVVVYTKACPKCHMVVEKDGGCEHMVCSKCFTAFCWRCCQPYTGTQYYHTCEEKEMVVKETVFSHSTPHKHNSSYNSACSHRLYKLPAKRLQLKRVCKRLLSNANRKLVLSVQTEDRQLSLKRFLSQIVRQILTTHNLLEYCCAVNSFRKGSKYCVPTISMLTYCVGALERELATDVCSQKSVDRIGQLYETVKSHSHLLVVKMSTSLSYSTPASCQ